jgi:hypothetical protein
LKYDVLDRCERNKIAWAKGNKPIPEDEGYEVIEFDSLANPRFSRHAYYQAKATMPGWLFDLRYRGIMRRPAGAVYGCFSRESHVIDPFFVPEHWPRYTGSDFGAPNFAAIFIAAKMERIVIVDTFGARREEWQETGEYVCYREYVPDSAKTAQDHIRELRRDEPGLPRRAWGGARAEGQWRLEFLSAGYPISEPDTQDMEVGIGRVWAMFQLGRLKIFKTCPYLIDQIESYSRPMDDAGNVMDGIEDQHSFHLADGLRYVVSGLDPAGTEWTVL